MRSPTEETTASSLASPAARWAMIGVWCCGIASSLVEGQFPVVGWFGMSAYVVVLFGALVLTSAHPGRLSGRESAIVVTTSLTGMIMVLGFAQMLHTPAAEVWLLNYSSYLVALAIPRGNWRAGGAAMVTIVATVSTWGAVTGQPLSGIVEMLAMPASAGVVGVLWLVALRRGARRLAKAQSEESRAQVASAAASEAARLIAEDMQSVAGAADPLLEHIESGRAITALDQRELAVVEGEIRDRIRVPRLHHPRLVAAVAEARRSGADLLLIDSDGQRGPMIGDGLAEALARTTEGAASATIRLIPHEDQPAAQAVVTDRQGITRRSLFGPSGAEQTEPDATGVQR